MDEMTVFADDAPFRAAHAHGMTKFALPSPFLIAVRRRQRDYSACASPTMEHLLDRCAAVLAREAKAAVEADIDIVRIDDPAPACFCNRRLTSGERIHDERLHRRPQPPHLR